jgi:hypothetical protein
VLHHASARVLVLCIDMDILTILCSSCTQAINIMLAMVVTFQNDFFGMQVISTTTPMASSSLQADQHLSFNVFPWVLCAS